MDIGSSAVGPFCCVAAVCPACVLYTDVADRVFRSRHHLLHELEQGEGRCAVRQYLRKAGGVCRQQQKPKEDQQQTQQQRWRQQQDTPTSSSSSRSTRAGGWRGACAEHKPLKSKAGKLPADSSSSKEMHAFSAREAPACTKHEVETCGPSKAYAGHSSSLHCRSPACVPTRAGVAIAATTQTPNTLLSSECTAASREAQACTMFGSSFLSSPTACERSVHASVAAISERCTRWKVLQLAAAAVIQNKESMIEEGGEIASAEASVNASRYEETVPRSPDVLLACTDYLLRFLLPSVIFPAAQEDHIRDRMGLHAVADKRRSSGGAKDVFSAPTDSSDSPLAAGVMASFSATATPADNRRVIAATSPSRSAAGCEEQQQQETTPAAAEGFEYRCGVASSHVGCSCMCHRFFMEGSNRERVVECAYTAGIEAAEPSNLLNDNTQQTSYVTSPFRPSVPAASSAATLPHAAVSHVGRSTVRAAVVAASGCRRGSAAAPAAAVFAAEDAVCGAARNRVYNFFADRLRALRQEAVVQQLLHRPIYFLLLLQSTRFHLFADVFWGGGLFSSSAHIGTNSLTPIAAGREVQTTTLLLCMQQQHWPARGPHESSHIVTKKANHRTTPGAAGVFNSAGDSNTTSFVKRYGKGAAGTLAPVAAATLLQTVGFSASLNRLLLASCMQQLLNFIISRARRFFSGRQRMHRQRMQQRQQQHAKRSAAAAPTVETDVSNEVHRNGVWREIIRREYSAEFYIFASLLQVQPQDVDEIVACALLYLLLPREDTPAQHQAVQLLLQQTASAFQTFWSECRWTQYAGRLVLLAAAGGMHQCLRELLLLSTRGNQSFFLQCSCYFHLDFLRAAVAADIKAAALVSSPGTKLPLVRLQQLLYCESPAAAMRLAHATGATLQQQQPAKHYPAEHQEVHHLSGELKRQNFPQQQGHDEVATSTVASEVPVNVYYCRDSHSSNDVGQCQSTRVHHHHPHGGSAATFSSSTWKATVNSPNHFFALLQSDAWQPSPPPETFSFPRNRTEMRDLFDWPTHYTTPARIRHSALPLHQRQEPVL